MPAAPRQPPDSYHLPAAQGWLELGNLAEANEELENISAELRAHPDVLKVRGENLRGGGWINRSFCLHELRHTVEARDNLVPVREVPAGATSGGA